MWMVTGATGYVGRGALRHLARRSATKDLAGLVRDDLRARALLPPSVSLRVANYQDRLALTRAFVGVERLLFIASDGNVSEVLRHHANVIEAAATAGIKRVVFLSILDVAPESPFYYAPVYQDAERRLLASGVDWTLLRCSVYADFVYDHWLQKGLADGAIELPVRQGRMSLVTRDDIAAAAASALVSDCCSHRTFALTGPEALDGSEIAAVLGRVFGTAVSFRCCGPAEYLTQARATLDEPWPQAFSTMFESIEQGRYARVGSGVSDLTGREPDNLEKFLAAARNRRPPAA